MNLENIKQQIITSNLAGEDELIGCTQQEVKDIEKAIGHQLPVSYQNFLILMGKNAGQFLRGSDCFYPDILDLNTGAKEILSENDFPETLPDDAFVFFIHQGYQFSFFRLGEGNDPPIYYFTEGESNLSFMKSHEKFTNFLTTEIELHKKYLMTPTAV